MLNPSSETGYGCSISKLPAGFQEQESKRLIRQISKPAVAEDFLNSFADHSQVMKGHL